MSITLSDLTYHYTSQDHLFVRLNLSIEKQNKVSIVGNNGIGKSTLLKLIAQEIEPTKGSIITYSKPYYIPQHTGLQSQTVAQGLRVSEKLKALHAITNGSISQADYDALNDNWDIESRCQSALTYWQLSHISLDTMMDDLSGGEKTKVFLAGLLVHTPDIILLDEPSNHLDTMGRKLLYQYIEESRSTMVIVSHDKTLLNRLDVTYELSNQGIRAYGGNYTFYASQKELEENALENSIHSEEKALRIARKKAQEVKEKQDKRLAQGDKKKTEVPRIFKKTLTNSSENTAAGLRDKHQKIIQEKQSKLSDLRKQARELRKVKLDFDHATIPTGKLLIEASGINVVYPVSDTPLWKNPIDFKLYSNDRIHILGNNGSGKTTLINLLTGAYAPTSGSIRRTNFSHIYLDQNYTQVDVHCTVGQLADRYNLNNLPEHEVKLRLNRFLFPSDSWTKNCRQLSGGEKMRLYLCCLMISNQTPDLIILDEPTNNLDITNTGILTQTIKEYRGSLLVISHDTYFVNEIGVTGEITVQ